jgi:hypothetical protein
MPCGQPKFSSMPSAPVSSTSGRMAFQALLLAGHHDRDDEGPVGPGHLDLLDLAQVDLEGTVGDQLDIVEPEQRRSAPQMAP